MSKKPAYRTRAIVFVKPEKAELRSDIGCPEVDDETVVIHTRLSGLSRGTEMDMYSGQLHNPDEYYYPLITGYEPLGEVVYAGRRITHLKVGDRAVGFNLAAGYEKPYCCGWGGAVEYAVYSRRSAPPEWYGEAFCAGRRVAKVPDSLLNEEAICAILAGVAATGIERLKVSPSDTVLIIGLGVIGNSAAQICQNRGAFVLATDLHPFRCKVAQQCGVRYAFDATANNIKDIVRDYTGGRGADIVIECSGEVANISLCIDLAAKNGRVHLQGAYLQPFPLIGQKHLFPKSLALSSTMGALPPGIGRVFQMIMDGKLKVKPMFSKTFPPEKVQTAYQMALHQPDKYLKMFFKWR